jgi:hypothetical protein
MKIHPVWLVSNGADMTKLIVSFRNFVKSPKISTAHKTNRLPLAVAEGKCVMDKFLIPKLHVSKKETPIIFGLRS